jgi:hypothetical protein
MMLTPRESFSMAVETIVERNKQKFAIVVLFLFQNFGMEKTKERRSLNMYNRFIFFIF